MRALFAPALVALAAGVGIASREARGDDASPAALTVSVRCDDAASLGRVKCEARASAGDARIAWGDVVVVKAPSFVRVLRGRIGPSEATERSADGWRWAFGVVAADRGAGEIEVRVRVVACDDRGTCSPRSALARAELAVK